MLTALTLELPVVWDSSAADRARVQGTVWVPVEVQGLGLVSALMGAARSSSSYLMHDLHRVWLFTAVCRKAWSALKIGRSQLGRPRIQVRLQSHAFNHVAMTLPRENVQS
jgi:hypothetical protein